VIRRRVKTRDGINCFQVIEGVHIWRAALDGPGWPPADELPPHERDRAAAFLREQVARRWVASRWALRRVLAHHLDLAPAAIELEQGEHGKPRLRDEPGLEFNHSHSEGLALVVVADRPVGVDVEAIRPGRDTLALAERALPAPEAEVVRDAPPGERDEVFHRAWARHEARLKCLGTGLGAPAPSTAVTVVPLDLAPGYAAAVAAVGRAPFSPDCRSLQPGY
jgi:4'-phosphopantetheinyl transferase